MTIGEKIKKLRKDRGLTQENFAKEIGISRFSLINYERGARKVPEDVLKRICNVFKTELKEDFFSYSLKKYKPLTIDNKTTYFTEGAPENMKLETFKQFLTLSGYSVEVLTFKELLTLHNKTREYIDFELFKQGHFKVR
ncbi:MAG: helix-turn-helix domain-containing protein [Clostridium sp.]|nr:helix-turn-helix domain-containing protein [Clostridium sp.]